MLVLFNITEAESSFSCYWLQKIEASLWTSGKLGHSASETPTNAKLEKAQKRNFLLSLPFWPTDPPPPIACQSFFFQVQFDSRREKTRVRSQRAQGDVSKEMCNGHCSDQRRRDFFTGMNTWKKQTLIFSDTERF